MKHTCLSFALLVSLMAAASAQVQPKPVTPAAEPAAEKADATEEAKPEMQRPTVWGEPTEVEIGMYVIDVDEINSAEQSFAASVFYAAKWKMPALRHEGPGPLNRRISGVWTPDLVMMNVQNQWPAFPGRVEIQPDGEVFYQQKVWGHFSQPLDLRDFPLDRQTLTVHIVAAGNPPDTVKMIKMKSNMMKSNMTSKNACGIAEKFSLPDFRVVSWEAESAPYQAFEGTKGSAGFIMRINVERKFGYFVIKIIVPLCLIIMMSWAPRWIDPEQIGANLGLASTAVLTLVAYFFSVSAFLPRVSYLTRMDRFVILSMVMVFGGLLHTIADCALVKRKKIATVERIERWARIVYPALLVAVLIVSFVL